MKELTAADVESIVRTVAEVALANEKHFSELDAAAGDADFGVSLAGGFRKVLEQWDGLDHSAISPFLLKVSMIISSNVGGCSGPIWGTGFMRAGMVAKGKETVNLEDMVAMLRSAMEGIMARGGAQLGDKTLLDALDPIAETLEAHSREDDHDIRKALADAAVAAEEAVDATKDWVAKRGRQSFTGERSCGTRDPGMVAVATMLREIVQRWDTRAS
jgi:dihydroxyacetone kinase phosphoprotein-dependent L subunit